MSETNSYKDTEARHGEHAAFLRVMADAEDLVSSAWPFERPEGYHGLHTLAEVILPQYTTRFSDVLKALEAYRNDPVYSGQIVDRTIELVENAKRTLQERVKQ